MALVIGSSCQCNVVFNLRLTLGFECTPVIARSIKLDCKMVAQSNQFLPFKGLLLHGGVRTGFLLQRSLGLIVICWGILPLLPQG